MSRTHGNLGAWLDEFDSPHEQLEPDVLVAGARSGRELAGDDIIDERLVPARHQVLESVDRSTQVSQVVDRGRGVEEVAH